MQKVHGPGSDKRNIYSCVETENRMKGKIC